MDYKKLTKDQLIQLLIEKDERLVTLNSRIEKIEAKLKSDSEAKFIERLVKIERDSYRHEQYSRRETIELVGLPENIHDQEALEMKVVEVGQHAGLKGSLRDFHAIHRLKKKSVVIAKLLTVAMLRRFFVRSASSARQMRRLRRSLVLTAKSTSMSRSALSISAYLAYATAYTR